MYSVFLLRRTAAASAELRHCLEASGQLRVAGSASSIFQARRELEHRDVDVLLTDLCLEDGAAVSLVQHLRRKATAGRPKILAIARAPNDPLLFATLSAGIDSFMVEAPEATPAVVAVRRLLRGESAMSAPLARQVLAFFDAVPSMGAAPPADERALDWSRSAGDALRLSCGELYMLVLIAQGEPAESVAGRLGLTLESVGRRLGHICRKLQWDVRAGTLALRAA